MEHKKGCKFKGRVKKIQEGSWNIGSGEISGTIWIDEHVMTFSDGENIYPNIRFKYCPECGIKNNEA